MLVARHHDLDDARPGLRTAAIVQGDGPPAAELSAAADLVVVTDPANALGALSEIVP